MFRPLTHTYPRWRHAPRRGGAILLTCFSIITILMVLFSSRVGALSGRFGPRLFMTLGPILMGVAKPAHVLTPSATVRRVINMTAIACVEAQIRAPVKPGA
jgi:hypothetical protein